MSAPAPRSTASTHGIDGREITWTQRKRPLSDAQINRLIDHLATLLDIAIERTDVNLTAPARGRRRKIKVTQPAQRSFLEPEQVWALLDAATALEAEGRVVTGTRAMARRAILATLVMGGERISELCETRRGNLNLGACVLRAGGKTAAGMNREIDLVFDILIDILSDHLARTSGRPRAPLFPSAAGTKLGPDNVRRMLEETADAANALCEQRGLAPIMDCTPQMLRRTNISLLAAAGYDPAWIMDQVGHTDPKLTLRIYTQVLKSKRSQEFRDRANRLLCASPAGANRPANRPRTPERPRGGAPRLGSPA